MSQVRNLKGRWQLGSPHFLIMVPINTTATQFLFH